jgi:ethanolamine utilization protein EutQ (cupin superfamily)
MNVIFRGVGVTKQAMQKANLDQTEADVHGLISKQTAELEGISVTRVRFDRGARWSKDLKPYAGTDSCELPHVAMVLSGRLHVVMDDGSEEEFGPNEIMLLPPGHDAWTVGDQACTFVEFSRGNDYYSA